MPIGDLWKKTRHLSYQNPGLCLHMLSWKQPGQAEWYPVMFLFKEYALPICFGICFTTVPGIITVLESIDIPWICQAYLTWNQLSYSSKDFQVFMDWQKTRSGSGCVHCTGIVYLGTLRFTVFIISVYVHCILYLTHYLNTILHYIFTFLWSLLTPLLWTMYLLNAFADTSHFTSMKCIQYWTALFTKHVTTNFLINTELNRKYIH